jgi:hypothetical protein
MKRDLWNRFMITLMGALIAFGAQRIWSSPEPLGEFRYMLSISIAALVIVLKVREMRKVEKGPESGV